MYNNRCLKPMVMVLALGIALSGCGKQESEGPQLQKLTGQWVRPDGGYVVEIKSVAADGKVEATYSNPNPIHVSKAEAKQDGPTIKLFIELRDVNYPGCTYNLTYDPQSDQLNGVYFQASRQQRYNVVFERIK